MKEHVAITQAQGHSSTRSSMQDITGQTCKLMPRHMLRSAINANDLVIFPGNHQSTYGPVALCAMGTRHLGSLPIRYKTDEVVSDGN